MKPSLFAPLGLVFPVWVWIGLTGNFLVALPGVHCPPLTRTNVPRTWWHSECGSYPPEERTTEWQLINNTKLRCQELAMKTKHGCRFTVFRLHDDHDADAEWPPEWETGGQMMMRWDRGGCGWEKLLVRGEKLPIILLCHMHWEECLLKIF